MIDAETMPTWFRPRWDATTATWDVNNWDVFFGQHENKPKTYFMTVTIESLCVFGLHGLSYSQLIDVWSEHSRQHISNRRDDVPALHFAEFFARTA